jgi:hypothetical protein
LSSARFHAIAQATHLCTRQLTHWPTSHAMTNESLLPLFVMG